MHCSGSRRPAVTKAQGLSRATRLFGFCWCLGADRVWGLEHFWVYRVSGLGLEGYKAFKELRVFRVEGLQIGRETIA